MIREILVEEGDWVEKDQPMAVLSNWEPVRNVAVTKAELEKAAATLRRLEDGATPEEIDVAVKEVERMESRVTFSQADAERAKILLESETISRRSAEEAQSEYQTDLADLEVARANLRLVESAATQADLEAARAEVRRLTAELSFREDELGRTRILAPAEGRVITPNLHLSLGKYLPVGGLLAELEDNRVARAEIEIPETDIGEVQVGDAARLKVWGFSDRELVGTVVAVSPSAEKRDYGQVVRVRTDLPNADGLLRSQMTGYGKVEGPTVPVWKAFLQLFIRFFRVEVWSWIP